MKDIKRRIKSVGSTMQITKAMELVSSSKLRKAKARAEAGRPYFEKQYELVCDIAAVKKDFSTVYTVSRPNIKRRLFIVIAGDRGLAGGYNSNIFKAVAAEIKPDEQKPAIIAIGKKAVEFYEKRDFQMAGSYPLLSENAKTADCSDIGKIAMDMFRNGEVDEVLLFYTTFVSPLLQEPTMMKMLPIDTPNQEKNSSRLITFDPSPEAVFDRVVPRFMMSLIFCAIGESFASELGARRNAMKNASDNAESMIADLSLRYNRARQEKITNEINEIVGGANASEA